jgi:hypothetical protein
MAGRNSVDRFESFDRSGGHPRPICELLRSPTECVPRCANLGPSNH